MWNGGYKNIMNSSDIKAIIFDLDGVICFTDQFHFKAWKEMADGIGVYFDEEINNRLRGVSRMVSLEIILEKSDLIFSPSAKEELAKRKNDIYVKHLETMSEKDLAPDTKSTLEELRRRGYKLAIGSSSKNTKLILKKLGLADFFDAVSDGTNITRSKPDPEVFLKAAGMLGIVPSDSLVVEDALSGIDAAVAGGFMSAGLGEAATHGEVNYSIKEFKDLLEIL